MTRASGQETAAVSVVIPTYRRGAILLDTIRELLKLKVQPEEILVVDQTESHPPDVEAALATFDLIPSLGKTSKNNSKPWKSDRTGMEGAVVRLLRLPEPSIPRAMNAGLEAAGRDVVLFLDDDIIPEDKLIDAHLKAHMKHADAWAVTGQVLQPEDVEGNAEKLKTENLKSAGNKISAFQRFSISVFSPRRFSISAFQYFSVLRRDLDFDFAGSESAWIENVMAGNLSVKREQALAMGGFDENFIPPVSYRFETEFAKRIIQAGGRIRFEPSASIRHLRAGQGGTRSLGSHLKSASPIHGVGDYYYALCRASGPIKWAYMLRRPFREVMTRFHFRHPWWIPVKFVGEMKALWKAVELNRRGPRLIKQV